MTTDVRQTAEATPDYAEKARELAEAVWIIGDSVHTYEPLMDEIATAILAALQSAHAAGKVAGQRALKIAQNAARTLDASKNAVIRNLENPHKDYREAVSTLDSEREANARLTAELETARAEGDAAGFERGVREAAAKAAAHVKPPTAFVSRAAIKADILALLPSQPK
jgi:hypothetical protein